MGPNNTSEYRWKYYSLRRVYQMCTIINNQASGCKSHITRLLKCAMRTPACSNTAVQAQLDWRLHTLCSKVSEFRRILTIYYQI